MRIGLSGKACSGKDSVARVLGLPRYAFADGLKEEIVGLLAIHGIHITVDDINTNKAKYRPLMQSWGTDFKRTFVDNDYWVKRLLANITTDDAIVTDVRFPNEADALVKEGFVLVRLEVSPKVQADRYLALYGQTMKPEQVAHASETILDTYNFKYKVHADAPLAAVVETVRSIAQNKPGQGYFIPQASPNDFLLPSKMMAR